MNEDIDKTIDELIASGQIDAVKAKLFVRTPEIEKALKQWNVCDHTIMERSGKVIEGGELVKDWKLPISYQKKIVQSSVAFLFGEEVTFQRESDESTDEVYQMLLQLREDMRMSTKDQENAIHLLSETESAKLFVPYRDPNISDPDQLAQPGLINLKCILLAKSLGDTLYTRFDEFGVLQAFARGYIVKSGMTDIEHLDIFTAKETHYCTKQNGIWDVKTEANKLGKIPVAYYRLPQTDWADVQALIERREWLTSTRADNNDRTGDPILVLEGNVVKLPGAKEVGKVVVLEPGGKANYLVPQMSVDMVKNEKEDLKELIHYLTDTPDLSMDKMSSLGLTSGKAIEMAFFGALLKAKSRHGFFREMIDRENNILKAYIGKLIDTGKEAVSEKLKIKVKFGNPLPDNAEDFINMLTTATGGKAVLSQKTAVSLNPLVTDAKEEIKNLNEEEVSTDPANLD